MVREIRVLDNEKIHLPARIPGVSEGGIMALAKLDGYKGETDFVVGRGIIRSEGESCLFLGRLDGLALKIERVLLHPLYPIDGATVQAISIVGEQRTWGFEDPSPLPPTDNIIEPGKWGVVLTEAYYSHERIRSIDCNTIYYGIDSREVASLASPRIAIAEGLGLHFETINLIKEWHYVRTGDRIYAFFEVGGKKYGTSQSASYVCWAEPTDWFGEWRDSGILLDPNAPEAPDWMQEHASTAANPILLPDGSLLTIFNARAQNTWRIAWCIHTFWGTVLKWGEPFINPPEGVEPGPGGQHIAFGSDFRMTGETTGEVLYHAQDRYPCIATVELVFD